MTNSTAVKNKPRNQYTPEFREQALALADTLGVAQAARGLNLYESQPYTWRSKARQQNNSGEQEQQPLAEIARLKRQFAENAL
jgi:transposase